MKIPITGPQFRQAGLPDVRANTNLPLEAFGGGVQETTNVARRTAQDGTGILAEHLDGIMRANVEENLAKMAAEETRIKQELSKVKGIDAQGAAVKATQDFDSWYEKNNEAVANERVRGAIRRHYSQYRSGLALTAEKYAADETLKWQDNSAKTLWESERDAAIADGSPERVNTAIARIGGSLADFHSRHKDLGEGWTEREKAQLASSIHFGVFSKLSTNDRAAKTYFEQNKGAFLGNDLIRAEKMTQENSTLGEAQRWADVVVSYDHETLQSALTHLDKLSEQEKMSPEVRERATSLTSQRFAVMQQAKKEAYINDVEEAEAIIEKTADITAIPAELRSRLRSNHLSALERRAKDILTKTEPVTDWKKYTTLKDMAADPERRKDFLETPPMAYRSYLSNTEFKEVVGLRAGLLKGDEKTKKRVDGYRTISGIVNRTLDLNGFKESENPEAREQIEQLMDEEVKYYRSLHDDQDPPNEEVKKMISKLSTEHILEDRTFPLPNKTEYGYETAARFLGMADTNIPTDQRKAIEDSLRRANVEPTRRRIMEVWIHKQTLEPYRHLLPK